MKFSDIPFLHEARLPGGGVHWDWRYLESYIHREDSPMLLDPDYQRGRVWTEAQQIAYVEYCLRGGKSGRMIYLNCKGWSSGGREIVEVVDGLQRITAARRFMASDLPVFGGVRYRDFEGAPPRFVQLYFDAFTNELSRPEVLEWYLQLNAGGTPHSPEELDRVRQLLAAETLDKPAALA